MLVFGTFDRLHEGHLFLLHEAKKLGYRLVVSVAQDSVVERFKKQKPAHPLEKRMEMLRESGLVDETVAGDTELGNWTAIREHRPDTIAIGYDQDAFEKRLREFIKQEKLAIKLVRIGAHEPERLHSRLLRKS